MKIKNILGISFLLISSLSLSDVNIYGPGGPAPVIKEISNKISEKESINIKTEAGPLDNWKEKAIENADIIIGGSEFMMNQFIDNLKNIEEKTIQPLKIREAGILVRKNNPKKIKSIKDLGKEGINVMVVDGAGQISLWEDMVGKNKDLKLLQNVRKNIVLFAKNSGIAKKTWLEDKNIDAVIIWKHWEKEINDSKFISVEDKNKMYRPALISLTKKGVLNKEAKKIYDLMLTDNYDEIWEQKGWIK
ncbi:MAG: substrate-binding domain-containing protein [Fusobacteriaceae bacterium]